MFKHQGWTRLSATILILCMLFVTACDTKTPETTQSPQTTQTTQTPTSGEANTETKQGGQLVTYVSNDPKGFDPATLNLWDQTIVAANILEGLVRLSPDGTQIEPGIAEQWSVSDDGLVWTFKLRDNAKFHNGRKVVAEDFKYSFERVARPETASPSAWMLNKIKGFDAFVAGSATGLEGVRAVNESTLELELTEAYAPFFSTLASASLAVVPKEAVEEFGEDFAQNVVAAGPFTLGQWNINQDLTVNAFEDYWAGRPYLDSVVWKVINDENTRIVEFDAGTLDIAWIPPAHYDRLTSDSRYQNSINICNTLHTDFISFNMEHTPFGDNKDLRYAFKYALDIQAVIDMLQGRASVANHILLSSMMGGPLGDTSPWYNVDKAKEFMDKAGYADGLPGTYKLITPNWNNNIKICEIYQQNLKAIGINIEIESLEYGAYNEALTSGQYDLAWGYVVAAYPDSDAMVATLVYSGNLGSGGNYARYSNAEADKLLEQARAATDDAERAMLYTQIEALVSEDLPYAYGMHNIYVDICQPYVQDYVASAVDVHTYHRVWIKK